MITAAPFIFVALLVLVVFLAKRALPDEYRWEKVFRDILEANLSAKK